MFKAETLAVALLVVTGAGWTACDDASTECEQPELVSTLSPVNLGNMVKRGSEPIDEATNTNPPYALALLLSSTCLQPVVIEKVCVVGDKASFSLRGPNPESVPFRTETAIEITYDRTGTSPNGKPEQAALVIQSNAVNQPTMVIPLCARTVDNVSQKTVFACESPVTVEVGAKDDTLCQ